MGNLLITHKILTCYRLTPFLYGFILEKYSQAPKGEYQVTVEKVIDGDTISVHRIDSSFRSLLKVRMSGIDAPEMKQFFGVESKNHLQKLIDSFKTNVFQLSVESTDMYGRMLGTLKSGAVDINK